MKKEISTKINKLAHGMRRIAAFTVIYILTTSGSVIAADTRNASALDTTASSIPSEAKYVLVLGQFAHQDWDWNVSFRQYLNAGLQSQPTPCASGNGRGSVTCVYDRAFDFLRRDHAKTPPYIYSSEVTGFLRAYLEENPTELQNFTSSIGSDLRLLGGGTTSPDNLLPSGESLLRNYLVGDLWTEEKLGIELRPTFWIPDDFGHDAQLPVVVEALGFKSASFARLPGAPGSCGGLGGGAVPGSPADQRLQSSTDFLWSASDGSSMFAHWMRIGYCGANGLGQGYFNSESEARSAVEQQISGYLSTSRPLSASRYVFIPVGGDFSLPVEASWTSGGTTTTANIRDFADWWNTDIYKGTQATTDDQGTYVVALDFANYADFVLSTNWAQTTKPTPFYPTPYWTGFYASRPELKILHQQATNELLAAETLGISADSAQTDQSARRAAATQREASLRNAWFTLTASTHHDYVTGTAADAVYLNEQAPQLRDTLAAGKALKQLALQQIAGAIDLGNVSDTSLFPLVVANSLGWPRSGVVEVPDVSFGEQPPSFISQKTDKGLLVAASAPALGYRRNDLETETPPFSDTVSLSCSKAGTSTPCTAGSGFDRVIMKNGKLQTEIAQRIYAGDTTPDWAIASLRAINNGTLGPELIPSGQGANRLAFYNDSGGLYNFGNDNFNGDSPGGTFSKVAQPYKSLSVEIIETGPLRAMIRTTVNNGQADFIRDYALSANEPHLVMTSTGGAAQCAGGLMGCTIATRFPLSSAATSMEYGTPYHWDNAAPTTGWNNPPTWIPPVFQATHDFVIPQIKGTAQWALYHQSLNAVSNHEAGTEILAVLWRNTPQDDHRGQTGHDTGIHTQTYALRVPDGLGAASTGQPLMESRSIFTPMIAAVAPSSASGELPVQRSLATTTGPAIVTAAKAGSRDPGTVVLRLYKPDNTSSAKTSITVEIGALGGGTTLSAAPLTALEATNPAGPPTSISGNEVTLTPIRAVTTISVEVTGQ